MLKHNVLGLGKSKDTAHMLKNYTNCLLHDIKLKYYYCQQT